MKAHAKRFITKKSLKSQWQAGERLGTRKILIFRAIFSAVHDSSLRINPMLTHLHELFAAASHGNISKFTLREQLELRRRQEQHLKFESGGVDT